jgi:hypothetical protein
MEAASVLINVLHIVSRSPTKYMGAYKIEEPDKKAAQGGRFDIDRKQR